MDGINLPSHMYNVDGAAAPVRSRGGNGSSAIPSDLELPPGTLQEPQRTLLEHLRRIRLLVGALGADQAPPFTTYTDPLSGAASGSSNAPSLSLNPTATASHTQGQLEVAEVRAPAPASVAQPLTRPAEEGAEGKGRKRKAAEGAAGETSADSKPRRDTIRAYVGMLKAKGDPTTVLHDTVAAEWPKTFPKAMPGTLRLDDADIREKIAILLMRLCGEMGITDFSAEALEELLTDKNSLFRDNDFLQLNLTSAKRISKTTGLPALFAKALGYKTYREMKAKMLELSKRRILTEAGHSE